MEKINDELILLQEAINKDKLTCRRFKIGFEEFDEAMAGGLKDGDLVIISGRSGNGKTSFAQTITFNLCQDKISTLWFSYEVTLEHLHRKFEEMKMPEFYQVFVPKVNTTGHLKWVKEKIQEAVEKYSTKVVFIDHIDFLIPSSVGRSQDNTSAYLKMITTELKSLAIELNVIIVCMAHLKKLSPDADPEMEDIGYSAGIFQLADYVIMVNRETTKQALTFSDVPSAFIDRTTTHTNNAIIKIVKNRETGINKIMKLQMVNNRFIK
jgi:replicative DNA helicase